ncbi:sugar phosphate isomerase/epimerase family protein [Raineyella fluvialis]|uniref:TIM barrel protein n=1 Tax=Raineyella fluvialis TaxID=2662261 RepID=A0A5Q2FCE0_9ACTN|nr:TIM barrel protein [Raineyella fluvialis]QGF22365.1 TIM barrel protein [Raineyella fluvialis]
MDAATCGPLGLSALTVLDAPPPDTVTAAAAAGFDAVGVRVFPAGTEPAWPMIGDTPMLRETVRRIADTGITLWDIEVLRLREDKTLEEQLAILDAGHALGARYVLVNVNDADPSRRLDRLNLLAGEAAARGLTLAVEYMVFTEIRTLTDAVALVREVEGPAVVLPDSLHVARSGGTLAELAGLPTALVPYAQLCDTVTEPAPATPEEALAEARTARRLPGDGDLALKDFVGALPAGTVLTVEAPVRDLPLQERCVAALASLRSCLS